MKSVPRKNARVYIVSLKGHDQGVEIHSEIHDAKLHDGNTDNYGIKHPVFPIPPYRSRNLLLFRFPHHFPLRISSRKYIAVPPRFVVIFLHA